MKSTDRTSTIAKIILFFTGLGVIGYVIITAICFILAVIIFIAAAVFIVFVLSMLFSGSAAFAPVVFAICLI